MWSYDFVFDQSDDGRTLKHLTVVDEFTKEGLMIEVQRSITSTCVIRCLDYLFELYGKPACIKSDNGPEFVAKQVQAWPSKNVSVCITSTRVARGRMDIVKVSTACFGMAV